MGIGKCNLIQSRIHSFWEGVKGIEKLSTEAYFHFFKKELKTREKGPIESQKYQVQSINLSSTGTAVSRG